LQALYRIGRTDISKLLTPSGENCFRFRLYTSLAVTAASPIAPVRFLMQMSARNAFGVRYVFDGRSHDRLAQRSSGLRMLLGPSPPSNIRRSIAPSVVGTTAPHAAAPYRASGFVQWHETDMPKWSLHVRYRGMNGLAQTLPKVRWTHTAVRCEQLGGFCRAEDGLEQKIMGRFGTQTIRVG
jgi:hypothetical protein